MKNVCLLFSVMKEIVIERLSLREIFAFVRFCYSLNHRPVLYSFKVIYIVQGFAVYSI